MLVRPTGEVNWKSWKISIFAEVGQGYFKKEDFIDQASRRLAVQESEASFRLEDWRKSLLSEPQLCPLCLTKEMTATSISIPRVTRETAAPSATAKLLWEMRQSAHSGKRVAVSGISAGSDTWRSIRNVVRFLATGRTSQWAAKNPTVLSITPKDVTLMDSSYLQAKLRFQVHLSLWKTMLKCLRCHCSKTNFLFSQIPLPS